MDPQIIGVNPTEIKNSVDDLPIIIDDEVSNIDNDRNEEDDNSSKLGESNGSDKNDNASNIGRE